MIIIILSNPLPKAYNPPFLQKFRAADDVVCEARTVRLEKVDKIRHYEFSVNVPYVLWLVKKKLAKKTAMAKIGRF
jgi:hypothetical protein